MKILIVGSGGREHTIAVCAAKSPRVDKIYCAPGNAGIGRIAECVPIGAMEFDKLVAFAKEKEVDLTIVGMEDPLVGGLVDEMEAAGLRAFGPRKNAAILEGSKAFSKDLMKKYRIPTAAYESFDDPQKALAYLEQAKLPVVLKADGLALGKGVLICETLEEAKEGVRTIMEDKKFGAAGNRMVVEEYSPLWMERQSARCPRRRTTSGPWTEIRGLIREAWAVFRRVRFTRRKWTGSAGNIFIRLLWTPWRQREGLLKESFSSD